MRSWEWRGRRGEMGLGRTFALSTCLLAFAVAVSGCGGSHRTSSTQTSSTVPPPAGANASPYLTRAGYAALRDTVALENARNVSSTSPSAVAHATTKLRMSCPHLGYDPANSQVDALRAECEASTEEVSTYLALGKCVQAPQPPARRVCFAGKMQRLVAILRRENNLDDGLAAAVATGPCRKLVLVGYADNARLANASDQAARAIQTAKAANEVTGPLRTWQSAFTTMIANGKREASSLKRQYPLCRPR